MPVVRSTTRTPDRLAPAIPFDYRPATRLVFGTGTVDRVGEFAHELGAKKVLLVTDPGIVAAGHAQRVEKALLGHVQSVTLYDRVRENPTTRDIAQCVAAASDAAIDFIVGLGGGSSMDTAKGCNFILTNGGRMQDYWGIGKARKPMLPLIAIPTTAGTGSECQSAALITDEETHQKMACLDPKAAAKVAILDPTLTLSQPPRVTACTGIDAIAHAVESAVTLKRTAISSVFSREALRQLLAAFPRVMRRPDDLAARAAMQLGASYAGIAIENSMLGAAHSAANPLTAHFGIVHGQAVGMMLPHVMRFNAGDATARSVYAELAGSSGISARTEAQGASRLVERIEMLLRKAGFPSSLELCGVRKSKLPALAQEAARQWTANFNPRPIAADDFVRLYRQAF